MLYVRALRPFSLDDFWDYEKHFTVMNYKEGVSLKQVSGGRWGRWGCVPEQVISIFHSL